MRDILLAGYYGMHNTGDDALLAASTWGIQTYLKPRRVWATASTVPRIDGAESVRCVFVGQPRFPRENGLRAYLRAAQAQGVVFGGGSVFHSEAYLRQAARFLNLAGKGPHAAVGVALGPFSSTRDEQACARVLRQLDFIGVRDAESVEVARALAPGVSVRKTFDLAPLLLRMAPTRGPLSEASSTRAGLGLSLCDYERFSGKDVSREHARRRKLAQLLDALDPAKVGELVFIDFNGHPALGDHALHAELASYARARFSVRHLAYDSDPISVLRTVGRLKGVLAMRLHAAVFGYLTGTPSIVLSYHPKCLHWAREVGVPEAATFDSVDFDVRAAADAIHAGVEGALPEPVLPVSRAEELALENWSWGQG